MKSLCLWMSILALPVAGGAADLCASAKAGVTIADFSFADGTVKASGTWQVGEDALGALLEYRLHGNRVWAESRNGTSGTWEVSLPWHQCDRSGLRVDVLPTLKAGNVLVHCIGNGKSALQVFTVSCLPSADLALCQWECSDEPPVQCSGTCTGTGKGGTGLLVGLHGLNGKDYQIVEGPSGGPWSWTVTCSPGDKVSFRVRDQSGTGGLSDVAERPCGKN